MTNQPDEKMKAILQNLYSMGKPINENKETMTVQPSPTVKPIIDADLKDIITKKMSDCLDCMSNNKQMYLLEKSSDSLKNFYINKGKIEAYKDILTQF